MYEPETHASRNIALCTKDCLCLFVCPVGATNTETGQIDAEKCISGCRLCVDACPSHAISLLYSTYPLQQEKSDEVVDTLLALAKSKTEQEAIARSLAETAEAPEAKKLAKAIAMSAHVNAEDIYREARYMLPQSEPTKNLLQAMLDEEQDENFPQEAVEKLLEFFH